MTITNRVSLKSVMAGVTPIPDVPDAPTIGTATNVGTSRAYNNGAATVAFTPSATGGTPTTYTATSTPGSYTGTGTSPITVAGLQSATSYTFTVTPSNSTATGPASAASNSITATTVPQAPTIGTATLSGTSASITFTAGSTGGSAITGYTVTSSPGALTATGASSPITVSGLSYNTAYTFTVTATNANGTSTASAASNSVTPAIPYWITTLGNTTSQKGQALFVDSSSNAYLMGTSYTGGNDNLSINKYNSTGTVQWSKELGNTGSIESVYSTSGVAVDSSGNVYTCSQTDYTGKNTFLLSKYNSSGALQLQRYIDVGNNGSGKSIAVDSSGNVYICGETSTFNNSGTNVGAGLLIKMDTSFNIVWQKAAFYTSTYGSAGYRGLALDSSGNVYVTGISGYTISGRTLIHTAKYNSSGTIQWQKELGSSSYTHNGTSIAVDSSGNVYVGGTTNEGGVTRRAILAKYDTSGNLQWQRTLTSGSATSIYAGGVSVDSSANIYFSASDGAAVFAKYNSSGTIQWQRSITSSANNIANATAVSSLGEVFVGGYTKQYGGDDFILAKVPTDGSKTGTYTLNSASFTYGASSYSDSATSLTEMAGSFSVANSSYTVTTATLTDSTPTYTAYSVSI